MLAIVRPAAPVVNPAPAKSSPVMTDAEFSAWAASQWLTDEPDDLPTPGLVVDLPFEPTAAESAWWLGFTLGADGVVAELMAPDSDEQAAFERGLDAGDDHLWTVDPLFASHLKERSERTYFDDADPSDLACGRHPAELAEAEIDPYGRRMWPTDAGES